MNRAKFYKDTLRRLLVIALLLLTVTSLTFSIYTYSERFESSLRSELQKLRDINQKVDKYLELQRQILRVNIPDTSQPDFRLSQLLDSLNSLYPEFKITLEQKTQEGNVEKISFKIVGEGSIFRETHLLEYLNSYEYPFILVNSYTLRDKETAVSIEISGVIALVR